LQIINNKEVTDNKKNIYKDSKVSKESKNKKSNKEENEDNNDTIDITNKILEGSTIYCREKERESITYYIKTSDSKCLYICGQPGTGKTSLVNKILSTINPNNETEFSLQFYFNCMCFRNANDFYLNLFEQIKKFNYILEEVLLKDEMKKVDGLIDSFKEKKLSTEETKNITLEMLNLFKKKFTP